MGWQRVGHYWTTEQQHIGVGCHFLFQRIFLAQGSNLRLLSREADSLSSEPPGKPQYNLTVSKTFSSVAQSCPTLCNPMDHSTPGLPVHHQLPEFTPTHVHRVRDSVQPSHPLLSPSLPALNLSQHQGLFKWVSSSHHVTKVLEFQPQHQSYQWTPRTDLLRGLRGAK